MKETYPENLMGEGEKEEKGNGVLGDWALRIRRSRQGVIDGKSREAFKKTEKKNREGSSTQLRARNKGRHSGA